MWHLGSNELNKFFQHLNRISDDIKFTMELDENERIFVLDVLITRNMDGSLCNKVFKKKIHIDNYIHVESNHHPSH
jgi:hypothetical protein